MPHVDEVHNFMFERKISILVGISYYQCVVSQFGLSESKITHSKGQQVG